LTGLPFSENERWAFLSPGSFSLMGSPVPEPVLTEAGKELGFRNLLAPGGVGRVSNPSHVGRVSNPSHQAVVYRQTQGLSILDECQNYWESKNKAIDTELLSHLAGSATPFDCLIDPADPRFATAGDMPLKIQAYCRETNQNVPRKPGPIYRCILESLALMYRKILHEICFLTDTEIESIYVLRGSSLTGMTGCHDGVTGCKPVPRGVPLLNHFAANALQLPIFVTSPDTAAIGNIVAQAVALGHIASLEEARAIVRASTKPESIVPHASIWDTAYDRFVALSPNLVEAGM
jgi:sugar (pentulose or hexulose) kinase